MCSSWQPGPLLSGPPHTSLYLIGKVMLVLSGPKTGILLPVASTLQLETITVHGDVLGSGQSMTSSLAFWLHVPTMYILKRM